MPIKLLAYNEQTKLTINDHPVAKERCFGTSGYIMCMIMIVYMYMWLYGILIEA